MSTAHHNRHIGLVSGRTYSSTRQRGLIEWRPQSTTQVLLDKVQAILAEYAQTLTVRQIFYRLVGAHDYDKTERAYDNLGEMLVKARRAGLIEWDAIRDDGDIVPEEPDWSGPEQFWNTVQAWATNYIRRPAGTTYVEIWVEAAGMVPQIETVANPLGVRVIAGGGSSSVTARYNASLRLQRIALQRPVRILLLGDYDPSGLSIIDVSAEDVVAFGLTADFEHLAVTESQARFHGLPSKPQKAADKRGATMRETWQAEALDPAVLAEIVEQRLSELIPQEVRDTAERQTGRERRQIVRKLSQITQR